jgi:hypothetical protein
MDGSRSTSARHAGSCYKDMIGYWNSWGVLSGRKSSSTCPVGPKWLQVRRITMFATPVSASNHRMTVAMVPLEKEIKKFPMVHSENGLDRFENMATGATGIHCIALTKSLLYMDPLKYYSVYCANVGGRCITKSDSPSVHPTMMSDMQDLHNVRISF